VIEIRLSRIYDHQPQLTGRTFLVERLWPRGVRRDDLAMDRWLKDVAPSTELRRWFDHDPAKWAEFRRRYRAELDANPQAWAPLVEAGAVTLLYSSRDRVHNNAGRPGGPPARAHTQPGGRLSMQKLSLEALAREHLDHAKQAGAGRSAHTVFGGHEHTMRQTIVALTAGTTLAEHENPGEATVLVLSGRVRLTAGPDSWDGRRGDLLIIPVARHSLHALEDAVILLSVANRRNDGH